MVPWKAVTEHVKKSLSHEEAFFVIPIVGYFHD
jgi:hypothetical protein